MSNTQTAQHRTNTKSPYTVVSDDRTCNEVVCSTLYEACHLARDLYINGFVVGVYVGCLFFVDKPAIGGMVDLRRR